MTARIRPSRFLMIVGAIAIFLLYRAIPSSPPPSPSPSPLTLTPLQPAAGIKPPIVFRPSTFDWTAVKEYFPVNPDTFASLPTPRKNLPRVQYDFGPGYKNDAKMEARRVAVRKVFLRCWDGYKTRAWGRDELSPVTGGAKDTFGGWAATMVDALDTLYIMELRDDFEKAAAAAVTIDWNSTPESGINLFETTIRHLGGLLSAYNLSKEPALLEKANELGEMLYHAFDTPNRMPGFWLNFENAKAGRQVAGTHDPSAGPTSLSMEFTRLAQITGNNKYFDAIHRVKSFLNHTQEDTSLPGMWPTSLNFQQLSARGDNTYTLGALADSLYEYLLKTYILIGGADDSWKNMYGRAMEIVESHLLFRPMLPDQKDILVSGNVFVRDNGRIDLDAEGQHLSCFAGGMFALGGKVLDNEHHVSLGSRLAKGCAWAYKSFPTGIMPEIFGLLPCRTPDLEVCGWDEERWKEHGDQSLVKGFKNAREPKYILRPEAIESIFILYRITGDEELRDTAWEMFEAIVAATTTRWGNSAIKNVLAEGETEKTDSMESFWLSETLKYFYLIFSDPNVISLDKYVFNTEAHPFERP